MNVRSRTVVLLLAAQVAILAWSGALSADDAIPCERRLPRDVVAYVSFRNIAEFRTQWAQTLTGQLWRDDSLADFRPAIETQLAEKWKEHQDYVGLTLPELLDIPHGELVVALAIQSDGKPGAVTLVDFGEKADAVAKMVEKLSEEAKNQQLDRAEEEFEDTKLIVYRRAAAEENKPPQDTVAYFIKDTFLVVGNGAASLKGVLNRWDGKHDQTLAENPVFRYVADKTRDEQQEAAPLMTWFIDPLGLVKAALAASPQAPPQASLIVTMLPLLGVDKFKGVGGSFDMARSDFDMVSRTLIYFEPPVRGALNMFQFDVDGQSPPKWVSDQASSYFAINWNLGKAYGAAESLFDSFQGAGAFSKIIQQLADHEQSGGVHLKKDLIDQLTGKVQVVGESSGSDDDDSEKYLIAVEARNVAGAKATLRKMAQIPGVQVKEREFQGETIYEIGSDDGEDSPPMGIVIAENHLMFGTDVKLLERVLRGTEGRETLADSPSYKRIAKRFPEKTSSISYNKEDNSAQSLLAFLKSPASAQLLGEDAAEIASKLPSIDVLKKYLTSSGSYMQPDERGLKITSFSLKKEAD
jgi:hypothetical protein